MRDIAKLIDCSDAFIGCPGDVEHFAAKIQNVWTQMPVPGMRQVLKFWSNDVHRIAEQTAAQGTQFHIARTSHPATSPVFILLGHSIGTPVRPPTDGEGERHWRELRRWLDGHGFGMVAMVGEEDYTIPNQPPAGKIPLTGTLFELFDAMRTDPEHEDQTCRGQKTFLQIYVLSELTTPKGAATQTETEHAWAQLQKAWCAQIVDVLGDSQSLRRPTSDKQFQEWIKKDLREAFKLPELNPWTEELPGLKTVSNTLPLLFGRGSELLSFTTQYFDQTPPALKLISGISGCGKSSFLRSGLMREWFGHSAHAKGYQRGWRGLLIEPALLQLDPTTDPLVTLGQILTTSQDAQREADKGHSSIGPLPQWQTETTAPPLEPATGDRHGDLMSALQWWNELTQTDPRPLLLIVDQAEQIEALARKGRDDIEATEQIVLSPAWWRFTALLAALAQQLAPQHNTPEATKLTAALVQRMPVYLILGLHRQSTLKYWPLSEAARTQAAMEIEPIAGKENWRALISDTCKAYGLTVEPLLLGSMAQEAAELGQLGLPVAVNGGERDIRIGVASVLPPVKVALGRLIGKWRDTHPPETVKSPKDLELGDEYREWSGITSAIETIGEQAWQTWEAQRVEASKINTRGLFERQRLDEQLGRAFSDLMAGLVDQSQSDRDKSTLNVELALLPETDQRFQRNKELIAALKSHNRNLVTRVDGTHWRFPHRALIDWWPRAKTWARGAQDRRETKVRLRGLENAKLKAKNWPEEELEPYARLVLDWIGSKDDRDRQTWNYVTQGLVERLDPAKVALRAENVLDSLPFAAIVRELDEDFVRAMIAKILATPAGDGCLRSLVMMLAQNGQLPFLSELLDSFGDRSGQIVNEVDAKSGCFPLLLAANNGHEECVARLLDAGADAKQVNEKNGSFPILLAARDGHEGCVTRLLDAGADPKQFDEQNGGFPLLQAAHHGHEGCVARLLDAGADPRQVDQQNGGFPLLQAAHHGHEGCVARLLAAAADPRQVDKQCGTFPLLLAAQNGHEGCVARLLVAGADPMQVNEKDGLLPLMMAAQNGHDGCVESLLVAGADSKQVHEQSGYFPVLSAAQQGHEGCVARLLDAGADPSQVNEQNGTFPLLQAAQFGHEGCLALLLGSGVDPNQVNGQDGAFPMLMAAQQGHEGCVARLLDAGVDPKQVHAHSGAVPLLQAAKNGHEGCVARLLLAGANPGQADGQYGNSPLLMAAQNDHIGCLERLLDDGADPSQVNEQSGTFPLLLASQQGHEGCVARLLDAGADTKKTHEQSGTFPLLLAAANGHEGCVARLLDAGVNPEQVSEQNGSFPLLMAAQNGHEGCVTRLLAAGADPGQVDQKDGVFPLLQAVQNGHEGCLAGLLDAGADQNQVNEQNGNFPLLLAAFTGHESCVTRLLDAGADPKQVDNKNGGFPLLLAVLKNHSGIVDHLIGAGADPKQIHEPTGLTAHEFAKATAVRHAETQTQPNQNRSEEESNGLVSLPIGIPLSFRELREPDATTRAELEKCIATMQVRDQVEATYNLRVATLDNLNIFIFVVVIGGDKVSIGLETMWLISGSTNPAVALGPGVNLDALAISLEHARLLPDQRMPEPAAAWAAIALLCGTERRQPLLPEDALPLPSGSTLPPHPYPESLWRPWRLGRGPEGNYVELPWIEEDRLVMGRVLVPENGVGARILPGTITIVSSVQWAIPQWVALSTGKDLVPCRVVGKWANPEPP